MQIKAKALIEKHGFVDKEKGSAEHNRIKELKKCRASAFKIILDKDTLALWQVPDYHAFYGG